MLQPVDDETDDADDAAIEEGAAGLSYGIHFEEAEARRIA
jgi:hypothetical protein